MAIHAIPPDTAGIMRTPPHRNGTAGEPVSRGDIEVLGRALRRGRSAPLPEGALADATAGEALRALRLLALDNLLDIVQLRETLAERDAQLRAQTQEASMWRQRALNERSKRKADATDALRDERTLVTMLHQNLVTIDGLNEELAFRRQRWWRRAGRHYPHAMPVPAPVSVPR
jgi:hypothetical protein